MALYLDRDVKYYVDLHESSIGPLQTTALDVARIRALELLKGKDNPFESLARPQRGDEGFHDLHVPELQFEERRILLRVIDWYRVTEYRDSTHLRPSRVVTVRGDRGSGKTHLVRESLIAREDHKPQLVVRPSYFDPNLPFEEYLFAQLKTTMGEEDEFHRDRPMDVITRPSNHAKIASSGYPRPESRRTSFRLFAQTCRTL